MLWNVRCCSCFLLLASLTIPSFAQDWTRFRGPNGTGISDVKSIPVTWTDTDYNWKTELPGIGHASPVIWGDKVFTLSADPQKATRFVVCISATTGQRLWVKDYPSTPHPLHARNSFASSTPAVDAEQVYVAWSTPESTTLKALTHDGRESWSLNLGPWVSQHGYGTSPVLYEDLVIVNNSQDGVSERSKPGDKPGESFVLAFDRKTGAERWRVPRVSAVVSYVVPFIYQTPGGQPELICMTQGDGMFSLDPKNGKQNWQFNPYKLRTIASPVLSGGLIYSSTGNGAGNNTLYAIQPGKEAKVVFEVKKGVAYVPCVVARDNLVFMLSDKGIASCIDSKTGETLWTERLNAAFSGSPVMIDNKIYCVDEEGAVFVIAAEKEFKLLAKNSLGAPCRSTPAISGGRLYLRTYSHLFSLGGKAT